MVVGTQCFKKSLHEQAKGSLNPCSWRKTEFDHSQASPTFRPDSALCPLWHKWSAAHRPTDSREDKWWWDFLAFRWFLINSVFREMITLVLDRKIAITFIWLTCVALQFLHNLFCLKIPDVDHIVLRSWYYPLERHNKKFYCFPLLISNYH